MEKGNILVIGNSGVGKSTLINAVLGEERAETGWGTKGTTDELAIYENENIPFRIIDTVGFEPSLIKEFKAINAVKKWSKESTKKDMEDKQINVIWFCVDGTARKLFPKTIENLSRATSMWKSVPIIVVITKSYSLPERQQNIEMVNNAFSKQKRYSKNLRKVIPVVASTYVLNESAYAAPEGIIELIDATNELMPEGVKAYEKDIAAFKLNRKRAMAHGLVGVSTTAGVVVGVAPIPFADALILSPIEIAEVNALAQIYGINKNEESKQFLNSIIEVGTVSAAAKTAISALKAIPGINIGASALNALIAGSIVAALGEGTIYAFEQVYLGKKSVSDIDWVKNFMESKLSSQFVENVKVAAEKITENADKETIAQAIKNINKSYKK
ncbi:MAG: YcjF family protein [Acutalibacteraceae bacterium]